MTNYKKGSDFEREIVNQAKKDGKIAFRSAGSHSPVDVVIVDWENKVIELVQCKRGAYTRSFVDRLVSQYQFLRGVYAVKFVVRSRKDFEPEDTFEL